MTCDRGRPITWAQQEWFADLGAQEQVGEVAAATNGCTEFVCHRLPVAIAITVLNDVVARHEGLRTLIAYDDAGDRVQIVCTTAGLGDVTQVVADGASAAAALESARSTAFQLDKQWPVVFVLVTDGDAVVRIGVVVDHVAIDAWGWKVLAADIEAALSARADDEVPFYGEPVPEQPRESAAWERGPDGVRHAARAERFWRRQYDTLRTGLGDWTPASGTAPGRPILRAFRLVSASVAQAAEAVTAATGTPASAVYLLAFASAVAEVEGTEVVGIQALTANRLSTGAQRSVRKAVMPAPVVVPRPGRGSFADRLTAIAHQQMDGFRFANIPPGTVALLADEILGERAGSGAVAGRFNFIDDTIVPGHINNTSLGGENIRLADPSIQDRVTADEPRPGGSRYILSVQHQAHGALLTLACHEDTAWCPAAATMLAYIHDLMVWAGSGYPGTEPRFHRD